MSKFKEQFCQFIDTNAKTLSKILKDINKAKMEKKLSKLVYVVQQIQLELYKKF